MADLPGTVHLVPQAPGFDAVGLLRSVGPAQVAVIGAAFVVAVFLKIAGVVDSAGAEVDGHHDLCAQLPAPGRKFIDPHLVGFHSAPCAVQPDGTLFGWSYAVLPPKAGNKIAAGITDQRNLKRFD